MKNRIYYLAFFILCTQCQSDQIYQPTNLKLLSPDEVIELAKAGPLVTAQTSFRNFKGNALNAEEKDQLNRGLLGKDYYVDEQGQVKEIIVRAASLEDQMLEIQVKDLAERAWEKVQLIDVDCSIQKKILDQVYEIDQGARSGGNYDMQEADSVCLQAVMSLIDKCGFPSKAEVGEKGIDAIWLVFQHSAPGIMAYYYPRLMQATEAGEIRMTSMALMQDRMLMRHGLRQIYGSQITNDGLYPVHDPENLNKRRAEIGLQPIEEYLERWGLTFRVEDHQ